MKQVSRPILGLDYFPNWFFVMFDVFLQLDAVFIEFSVFLRTMFYWKNDAVDGQLFLIFFRTANFIAALETTLIM